MSVRSSRLARIIAMRSQSSSYESWTREELISRLRALERKSSPSAQTSRAPLKARKAFDFSSYPKRKIALKFCYSGQRYNGLVFQEDDTPLPTVEETLYDALASCRLIDGPAGPQACGWERCGRTDRGVSSSGQVVSLWVRSNVGRAPGPEVGPSVLPSTLDRVPVRDSEEAQNADFVQESDTGLPLIDAEEGNASAPVVPEKKYELRYISLLNRVLPPTIRILAWAPVATTFSARFNCKYRHYKYYFTPDGLNIDLMKEGAKRLLGEHDFRNLCKIDPSKQLTTFRRKILRADISPVSIFADNLERDVLDQTVEARPHMYVLDLVGTAFLYNQVRHIAAILFLIGTGLEPPSVMTALLNSDPNYPEPPLSANESPPEFVDRKPEYQIADSLPLVLWDCAYGSEDIQWRRDEQDAGVVEEYVNNEWSLSNQMHAIHSRSLVETALQACFLRAAAVHHPPPSQLLPLDDGSRTMIFGDGSRAILQIPLGGAATRRITAQGYVPLLRRKRLEHVDVVNERWRSKKGVSVTGKDAADSE